MVAYNHLRQDGVKSANVLGGLYVKDTGAAPHGKTAITDFLDFQVFHGLSSFAHTHGVKGEISRGTAGVATIVDSHKTHYCVQQKENRRKNEKIRIGKYVMVDVT